MADLGDNIEVGDITKLKVADLKRELKLRGLDSNGNKSQLIARLQNAVGDGEGSFVENDSVLTDNDEMLDDDEVLADETLDDDLVDIHEENITPELARGTKRKALVKEADASSLSKKITLNRTAVVSSSDNDIDESEVKEGNDDGKNVIKLSEFTVQERLEKRAAKFGLSAEVTSDVRKEARAARFGVTTSTSSVSDTKVPSNAYDLLKKRSDRFGSSSVSTIMTKAEEEEKMRKRRERFGLVEPSNGNSKTKVTSSTTSTSTKVPITFKAADSNSDTDEKKKVRAERFKIKI